MKNIKIKEYKKLNLKKLFIIKLGKIIKNIKIKLIINKYNVLK